MARPGPCRARRPDSTPRGHTLTRLAVVTALSLMAATPASSQMAPSFGGVEVRGGLAIPQDAELGTSLAAEVDLGYVATPPLRLIAGLSRYQANIDREPGGDEGSFTATGFQVGARYDVLRWQRLMPYLRAGVTLHAVDADAFDLDVGSLLEGTYVGVGGALGAAYRLDDAGRLAATAEARRTLINNVGSTTFEIGIRLQRLGRNAYVRRLERPATRVSEPRTTVRTGAPTVDGRTAPAPAAAGRDTAAERTLADLQRALVEAERALEMARAGALPAPEVRRPEPDGPTPAPGTPSNDAMLRQGLARAAAGMQVLGEVREDEREFRLVLDGGVFSSGSPTLTRAAREEMRVLATILAGYPGHIITVEGHTDAVGNPAANQALSEARAASVRAALIAEGVDPLWLGARGFGQQRPAASNETAAGRAANRRVEIRVVRDTCPVPPRTTPGGALGCPR